MGEKGHIWGALQRLQNNSDFLEFLEVLNSEEQSALDGLKKHLDPVLIHRAQGAALLISKIKDLLHKALTQ